MVVVQIGTVTQTNKYAGKRRRIPLIASAASGIEMLCRRIVGRSTIASNAPKPGNSMRAMTGRISAKKPNVP